MNTAGNQSVRVNTGWGIYDDLLYRVTTGFNLFVRGLFSSLPEGSYRWVDDHKLTEIVIVDQQPVNEDLLEKRPAIVTIRGPGQWAVVGMGQHQNTDLVTGKKTLFDLLPFSVTFACLSREGVEAQRLAWFLFTKLPLFKGALQRSIPGLQNIDQHMTLGTETMAGNLIQSPSLELWRMVTVTVPVTAQYQSSIEELNKDWLGSVEVRFKGLIEQEFHQVTLAK